jgi:Na+/proline symporter
MVDILMLVLGVSKIEALVIVVGIVALTSFISTLSGLWGVLVTDLFQFALKMAMVILLGVLAVRYVGGIDSLESQIRVLDAARGSGSRLSFFPAHGSAWMPALTLFVYLAVNWWASWYPGAEPGGGGYVAQRIFSAKNERHGVLATLWFNVAHYALRPWPWIVTALATIVLYPNLADKESGYILTLMDPRIFPTYLRGFMLAAFAAAYMSTIGTQLNWGASYVINDWYRRFIRKHESERHYIFASRLVTVLLTAVSIYVTLHLESIGGAWKLLLVTGAGTGGVLLLRWYWWRINAWSEVSAMIVAAAVSLFLQVRWHWNSDDPAQFGWLMLLTVAITTAAWLFVTLVTPAESTETLVAFYRRVRPSGPGWKPIAAISGVPPTKESLARQLVAWVFGCVLIYALLFGIGLLILGPRLEGAFLIVIAAISGALLLKVFEPQLEEAAPAAS